MEVPTAEVVVPPKPPARGRARWIAAVGVGVALYVALFFLGEEPRRIALDSLNSLPFLILAGLTYAGMRYLWARVLAVVWLAFLLGGLALFQWSYVVGALLPPGALDKPGDEEPLRRIVGPALVTLALAGLGFLAGWPGYLPAVRRAVARVLPIDPRSFVHATALVLIGSATLLNLVPLLVLGQPPLLLMVQSRGGDIFKGGLRDLVYNLLWLVPAAFIAVGFPLVRTWRAALARLGLVRPTGRQALLGLLVAVLLVPVNVALSAGTDALWRALGWPVTNAESFEKLIAFALSPLGALVLGVTAGLGEELAVRGVLQPRLGILLSALFFTSGHAAEYGFDVLVVILVLGLVFGVVRRRANTSTAVIAHAVYDALVILLATIQVPGFT